MKNSIEVKNIYLIINKRAKHCILQSTVLFSSRLLLCIWKFYVYMLHPISPEVLEVYNAIINPSTHWRYLIRSGTENEGEKSFIFIC